MSDKTEPPTDKKLEDAREKGQVPQSGDLSSAVAFVFALMALVITAPLSEERLRKLLASAVDVTQVTGAQAQQVALQLAYSMVVDVLWISAPVLVAAMLGSLIGGLSHVGFLVSFDPLTPKLDKLNPVAGVKRIFSLKSLFEVFKSIVKAVFIGWVLYDSIRSLIPVLIYSGYGEPAGIGQTAWHAVQRLFALCAVLFIVLGVLDFVVQKLLFLKDQKMSKDEIKREYKQMEGDPLLKGERRAIAEEMAYSDPSPAVASANAVVVNPTHYAVALRYVPEECALPVIVAKGVDAEAALIRDAATKAGVPIIGNPELARALYKVALHAQVPEALLEAAAIVLNWADQLRQAAPSEGGTT